MICFKNDRHDNEQSYGDVWRFMWRRLAGSMMADLKTNASDQNEATPAVSEGCDSEWAWKDSNLRRHKPSDLQSESSTAPEALSSLEFTCGPILAVGTITTTYKPDDEAIDHLPNGVTAVIDFEYFDLTINFSGGIKPDPVCLWFSRSRPRWQYAGSPSDIGTAAMLLGLSLEYLQAYVDAAQAMARAAAHQGRGLSRRRGAVLPAGETVTRLVAVGREVSADVPAEIADIVNLFRHDASGPCVYFLYLNKRIVYVGQSFSLAQRLHGHADKEFDEVFYLPCHESYVNQIEARYIRKLDPPLNRTFTSRAVAPRRNSTAPSPSSPASADRGNG